MSMHSFEDRKRAVELYIESGFSPAAVKNALGYPARSSLYEWYRDYLARGYVKKSKECWSKHSLEEKTLAVERFLESGKSVNAFVSEQGWPSRTLMYQWIDELAPGSRKIHSKRHVLHSDEERICAVKQAYSKEEKCVADVISSADVDKVTFYQWRKKIFGEDAQNVVDDLRKDLPDDPDELKRIIAELKVQAYELKLEIAIRKGTSEILKKMRAPTRTG